MQESDSKISSRHYTGTVLLDPTFWSEILVWEGGREGGTEGGTDGGRGGGREGGRGGEGRAILGMGIDSGSPSLLHAYTVTSIESQRLDAF